MKIAVIADKAGTVLIAMRLLEKGPLGVGIKPRDPSHTYHEVSVPEEHHKTPIRELIKRIHIHTPGAAPHIS